MEYGQNIAAALRAIRGLRSQAEFAEEIGISKSTVQAIERGCENVRLDTLELICKKLDISPAALLDNRIGQIDPGVLACVLQKITRFDTLSPTSQCIVLQHLESLLISAPRTILVLRSDPCEGSAAFPA